MEQCWAAGLISWDRSGDLRTKSDEPNGKTWKDVSFPVAE